MAIVLAQGPTTRPRPLSPSTVAVLGVSRTTRNARARVDPAEGEHIEISVQPGHAVRVDSAQVAGREHVGGEPGVGLGNAEMQEDACRELAEPLDRSTCIIPA